jgi:hypothetical protein
VRCAPNVVNAPTTIATGIAGMNQINETFAFPNHIDKQTMSIVSKKRTIANAYAPTTTGDNG